ncbi:GntR family transcriptional regulator [Kocuria sp. CPCC 205261]|uniref:GntR family transcriptional regulator n=1 Tax=Kocuria sp. CPCC 205261 TaxID=3073554 RepID=UPI0034D48426
MLSTTGTARTGTAKYAAVRDHLLDRIEHMSPGDQLPPEPVLCKEYGVSRITLRHAVDEVIADGRLIREQGRGTFVVEPQYRRQYRERFADEVTGFYIQQTSEGFSVTTTVLAQQVVPAGVRVAEQLQLNPADKVVELTRLRYVNGTLHHHVVTCLPWQAYPDTATADFSEGSLYHYLRTVYGVVLTRNDLVVSVEPADATVAQHLEVPEGERLLTVASTVYDAEGAPVGFGISRHTPANSELAFSLRSS